MFLVTDGNDLKLDHYNGVYVLGEKIKKGESRVNIQKIGDQLSGEFRTSSEAFLEVAGVLGKVSHLCCIVNVLCIC